MEAIETLMSEHRTILAAIDALVAFADGTRRGGEDRPELARFVRFIKEFADAHHHAKEEGVLFEAMAQAGFPRQTGPIGVMLHEHDVGRQLVGVLAELAAPGAPWGDQERDRLAEAAQGYAGLLRAHIHKEDAILYPMAIQRLPDALVAQVELGCAEAEAAAARSGQRAALEQLAGELVARHTPGVVGGARLAG
jgi:hemerythrin-like domain-containing protein